LQISRVIDKKIELRKRIVYPIGHFKEERNF
jgi:hypothetical protein